MGCDPRHVVFPKDKFFLYTKKKIKKEIKELCMDNERLYLIFQLLLQLKPCQRFLLPLFPLLRGQ